MITEDYISFETAKLLKEKGFDEICQKVYLHDGTVMWAQNFMEGETFVDNDDINAVQKYQEENWSIYLQGEYAYLCPTQSVAMKWLREVHNINPVPYALSLGWAFDVFDLSDRDITGCEKLYSMDLPSKSEVYNTYEEACEAAIKYCLENLT